MKKVIVVICIVAVGALFYWAKTATTQDTSAPEVVSTNPGQGAKGVRTNASIHVYFSEPMDPSSITSNTFTLAGSLGSTVTGEVTYSNRAAAFIPFTHMDELTTYKATISGSVTDSFGNSLGSDYSWSFQTAEE